MNHSEIVSFIWGVADLIRDTFKRGKYQDVILPLTVLRRLDCVLEATKRQVLATNAQYAGKLDNPDQLLRKASGYAFYNTSQYDFSKLLDDSSGLAANLRNYINGFSPNMREVLEKFDFDNTIHKLDDAGLLFKVLERFKNARLQPDQVSNVMMGTIFEELIRKFNESLNENPGEHFTPRDVVHLMVDLLLAGDEERITIPGKTLTVYDPCCGSGGMLTIAKDHILGDGRPGLNPQADIYLFGQEVNPETYAICKSDLYIKSADGRDAENIRFGSTLAHDCHLGKHFDYLIANPPYGKDWKRDEDAVQEEYEKGYAGRFGAGLPRISDGQLLFLQHMLSHIHNPEHDKSRVAIIMNGSPLFTGDAGSGESEIRRWILENDRLEALIAMPEQLFYNTGISTYIWILSNRKEKQRLGKVQLIDASSFWTQMRKSMGDKRREIPAEKAAEILKLYQLFKENEYCKIVPTTFFGFRKITVERPLRLNFQVTEERLQRLGSENAFINLAVSKKKEKKIKEQEEKTGRDLQEQILALLRILPDTLYKNRDEFSELIDTALKPVKPAAPLKKAILNALAERDETADVCLDSHGNPEADLELRDTESVPLSESVYDYFDREVKPFVADAWINTAIVDHKDGEVGKVGYEINFNRYFYRYTPPRPLEEIEADIKKIEKEILDMLGEMNQ
ncbi:MAG TPA: class I SAM-dependent DNA methyltransferase [bacterium]|nr:class I SAM-dependent DNA methyltransferase [bacterium]HPN44851.1 class I SAM-dependent DNA methyltransferase [bacterium]